MQKCGFTAPMALGFASLALALAILGCNEAKKPPQKSPPIVEGQKGAPQASEEKRVPYDAAAIVMMVKNDVQVRRGGKKRPAKLGQALRPADHIVTGDTGWAVLALKNDHLVRVESDLALAVGDFILLKAATAKKGIPEQLGALVNPAELMLTPKWQQDTTRVAGWHARMTAGQTVGANQQARAKEEVQIEGLAAKNTVVLEEAETKSKRSSAQKKDQAEERFTKPAEPASVAPPALTGETAPSPRFVQGEKSQPLIRPLPVGLLDHLKGAAMKGCVEKMLGELGVSIAVHPFEIRVVEGKIDSIRLGKGLPTPTSCMPPLPENLRTPISGISGNGWIRVDVPR
jgi:hypothetical protein